MITAGAGWLIMLYGLLAELDTGLPDGTGCSRSRSYEACMYDSERNGLIAWAVTLGLGALGVVVLVRAWRPHGPAGAQRALFGVAVVGSGLLMIAGIAVWVHGVRGGWYADKLFYDDNVGAAWWNVVMGAGLAAGAVIGRIIPLPAPPTDRT